MEPYDHDKVELANKITIKINSAQNFDDLKNVTVNINELGIQPASGKLYESLRNICNPTSYIGKDNEFRIANDIYGQVLNAKDDVVELYTLLEKAETLYPQETTSAGTSNRELPQVRKPPVNF